MDALEKDMTQTKRAISDVEDLIDETHQERTKLAEMALAKKAERDHLHEEVMKIEEKAVLMQSKLAETQGIVAEQQHQYAKLQNVLSAKKNELERLQNEYQASRNELDTLKDTFDEQTKQIFETEKRVKTLTKQINKHEAGISSFTQKIKERYIPEFNPSALAGTSSMMEAEVINWVGGHHDGERTNLRLLVHSSNGLCKLRKLCSRLRKYNYKKSRILQVTMIIAFKLTHMSLTASKLFFF